MDYRTEHDTMGEVRVPSDRFWGAQTQRSLENFCIGHRMPAEIIHSFGVLKEAAALANEELGVLDSVRAQAIAKVCREIADGKLDDHFPLVVYQTGSGTQTNMNVNEVVTHCVNLFLDEKDRIHPNDHVNKSQSSNDTFPTAMHISAVSLIERKLMPTLKRFAETLKKLEEKNAQVMKVGRTHLQDATPLTFGQEISGWCSMIEHDMSQISLAVSGAGDGGGHGLSELALGGTAVGTGLNAPDGFDVLVVQKINELYGKARFVTAPNKFHALTSKDAMVFAHGALKGLAADMMKIANDVRWMASGPRCGIGEITIPANEPGSSIMPGKVNPTQCEAMTMVSARVMGNDVTIGIGASQGNFELNVFMPVMADAFIESVNLLAEGIDSFDRNCVSGILANTEKMEQNMERSLMNVTKLVPEIGYEKAAEIAAFAAEHGLTIDEAREKWEK